MKVDHLLTNLKTLLTIVLATSTVGSGLGLNDGWVEGIYVGLNSDLKCFSLCDLPNIGSNGSTRSELNGSSLSDLKRSSFRDFPNIGSNGLTMLERHGSILSDLKCSSFCDFRNIGPNGLSELSESALVVEVGSDKGIVCRRPPDTSCW